MSTRTSWQQCWYRTANDPYSLDTNFIKRLAKFDNGRIRIRWSHARQKWAVERKMIHTVQYVHAVPEVIRKQHPQTKQWYSVLNETYITARDGYIVIDYIDVQPVPHDWVIHNLQVNDMRRWGSTAKVIEAMEKMEQSRIERKHKDHADRMLAKAEDAYDILKKQAGEIVYVPSNYTQQ